MAPFNRKLTRIDKDRIIGTKNIRQFFDVNEGKVIKIREINTPLYLFFVAVEEYDKDGKPLKELIRRKVKVEWRNEEWRLRKFSMIYRSFSLRCMH